MSNITPGPDLKKTTAYVVLRADEADTVGNVAMSWSVIDTHVVADNSGAAVRKAAQASGAYVAIPKRSFQQVLVEVETAPRVKIVS